MANKSYMLEFVRLAEKTARVRKEGELMFSREFQRAKGTGATDMLAREIAVEATGAGLNELDAIMKIILIQMEREARRPFPNDDEPTDSGNTDSDGDEDADPTKVIDIAGLVH